jgi:hypothetical protein
VSHPPRAHPIVPGPSRSNRCHRHSPRPPRCPDHRTTVPRMPRLTSRAPRVVCLQDYPVGGRAAAPQQTLEVEPTEALTMPGSAPSGHPPLAWSGWS